MPHQGWIGQFSPQIIQMITEQPILWMKPQRKLFFLNFQSETCCKPTVVTRYYLGKVSRNRIIHRLRTSMLDTLEIALLQPHGILIWIIDLHFMAKWRSPSFKYRRGFDLLANVLKIQQRTLGRCSYFQFVSLVWQFTVSPKKFRRYGRF